MIGVYWANGLGNAVMLTPFLAALREARPGTPIHVIVATNPEEPGRWQVCVELWRHYRESRLIDHVEAIERTADPTRVGKLLDLYSELVCFPHGEPNAVKDSFMARDPITAPRPAWETKHEVLHYMDGAYSIGYRGPVPPLQSFAAPRMGGGESILLCNESATHQRFLRKRWGKFEALADAIREWTGRSVEMLVPQSIADTAERLRHCYALVTTDTFTMHLAAAIETPMVTLWGPTRVSKNHPWATAPVEYVRAGLSCQPCQGRAGWTTCDEAACMRDLTVGDVMAAWRRLDARIGARTAA